MLALLISCKKQRSTDHVLYRWFSFVNPFTRKSVSKELLDDIVMELQKYKDMKFYTCHCTGKTAFDYLSHHMNNIYYISCGETVEI